jgi:hypothetical protein
MRRELLGVLVINVEVEHPSNHPPSSRILVPDMPAADGPTAHAPQRRQPQVVA